MKPKPVTAASHRLNASPAQKYPATTRAARPSPIALKAAPSEEMRPHPAESVEEGEGGKNAQRKAAAGRGAEAQNGERGEDADEVDKKPARAEPSGLERDEQIAREIDETP